MTASIGELEASLQRAVDVETLAVYADALEAAGDPRGELIAIDLELANVRSTVPLAQGRVDELIGRKRDVLRDWLGDSIGGIAWEPRQFEYGLLREVGVAATSTESIVEYARGILDSPVGRYLRGLLIYGSKSELEDVLALGATHPLPWLQRLTLHRVDPRTNAGKRPIDRERWTAFVAAAPNLVDLSLIGSRVLATPVHPQITTLRLIGGDGIVIGAEGLPGVTTLDLALRDPEDYSGRLRTLPDTLAALINPRTFPALRTLDLSRNEGAPDIVTTANAEPGALQTRRRPLRMFLDAVDDLGRFAKLRLPAITGDADTAYVLRLLDAHPTLAIEIARMWDVAEGFEHPRLRVPVPRVWPAPGIVHGRDALTIAIPPERFGEDVALSPIVRHLEEQFDDMPPEAQQAWLAVWAFLDTLDWEDERGDDIRLPFDATTLLRALEALDGNGRCDDAAKLIRDAKLPAGATVIIHRYWGW